MTGIISKRFWWIFAVGIVLIFYFFADPMQTHWMPQCVFHKLTGLQCMGCGSQRMAHALLHGNFKEAFEANAFIFCCLPVIGFMIFVEIYRKKFPGLYRALHTQTTIIASAALLMAWLLIRNFLNI